MARPALHEGKHLRSRFLDVASYPEITFTVARVEAAGQAVTMVGFLRVRVHGLDAEAQVNRADFGLGWSPARLASTHNTIGVHAVFVRR